MIDYIEKLNKKENFCEDRKVVLLSSFVCFLTNLSQLPKFVSLGVTQHISIPIWIILLIYCFITKKIYFDKSIIQNFIYIWIILIVTLIFNLINGNNYITSSIFISLLISLFIYTIGKYIGNSINKKSFDRIIISYIVSTVILTTDIYIKYFYGKINLSSTIYAYSSKNSVSQIIFTSIIMTVLIYPNNKKKVLFLLKGLFIIQQLIVLFLLRSRATIVGLLFCIICIILFKTNNKRLKIEICLVTAIVIGILLLNYDIRNYFFLNVILAGRSIRNMDEITSGRLTIISKFPILIRGHLLEGIGRVYFECFPLSAILQFGLPIGIEILLIAYKPVLVSIKWRLINEYTEMFFLISIGYFIDSFFEGLAPIGPGVKCYFMWLMFGLLSSKMKY